MADVRLFVGWALLPILPWVAQARLPVTAEPAVEGFALFGHFAQQRRRVEARPELRGQAAADFHRPRRPEDVEPRERPARPGRKAQPRMAPTSPSRMSVGRPLPARAQLPAPARKSIRCCTSVSDGCALSKRVLRGQPFPKLQTFAFSRIGVEAGIGLAAQTALIGHQNSTWSTASSG